MSTCTIFGFFPVKNGRKVQSVRASDPTQTNHHVVYDVVVPGESFHAAAELRAYKPATQINPLPDNTIVFLIAKLYVPASGALLLEASQAVPCPGDPSDPLYEDSIPEFLTPAIFLLGPVISVVSSDPPKSFTISVKDYVRGLSRPCTILCVFASNTKRWNTTRLPKVNSVVFVQGSCANTSATLPFRVTIDHIEFDVAPPPADEGASAATEAAPETPGAKRRRKFPDASPSGHSSVQQNAVAGPSTVAGPSNTSRSDGTASSQTASDLSPSGLAESAVEGEGTTDNKGKKVSGGSRAPRKPQNM